ncbi:biotin--[acetyl-CoA-carboxylase] ligase [Fructobacillus papyrifericola]|uniref:biotin--[biotin carboxyl-carrier protein] ligase n=1 Tax=Fructobacillus papyrifericola TaxID=2713172 RepID=A0ABS5QRS2_9LACO|nr:biotin--[acetyl-CoA-carboxylase] ligase [Fructobacillus papyrifericola]MBS9335904.1 biotin--[acetyl-CoA-carboxylase] ligase [Fructobacillus papyrifericola]
MVLEKLKTKDRVLDDLLKKPGTYFSGDQLATDLAISRESVWKAVKALQKDGHRIVSKKKSGYAYLYSDHVNEHVLTAYLEQLSSGKQDFEKIMVFDNIGSTQTYAKDYVAKHPSQKPAVFTARTMDAGYGRRGRAFFAAKDRGIYLSMTMPVARKELVASLLTTSAAVVLAQVIEEFFPGTAVSLKWVNDLIVNQHKVGGILTEAVYDMENQQFSGLVPAFFVNLLPADYPEEISNKAGSVLQEEQPVDLNLIAATVVLRWIQMANDYLDGRYMDAYRERSFLIGQVVTVQVGQEQLTGEVVGISNQGALELKLESGETRVLYAGEVTKVKLMENLNL